MDSFNIFICVLNAFLHRYTLVSSVDTFKQLFYYYRQSRFSLNIASVFLNAIQINVHKILKQVNALYGSLIFNL